MMKRSKPARIILHIDLDAFFCCVEELRTPALKSVPFAVGGTPDGRGVVASCSYAARAFGVRSAMPMAQAIRLCPNLRVLPTHFDDYRHYSRQVIEILHSLTPLVEQLSIDEAFLDVTGLKDPPYQIAKQLQTRILSEVGLPCSIGVAASKLVAKIANNRGKATQMNGHTPQAIEVVPHGNESAYLAPLPVSELWGVGQKTEQRLQAMGIQTIGQLAMTEISILQNHFGKHGYDLWNRANARDNRPVETEHETKSVSSETTFNRDVTDMNILVTTLTDLTTEVARRLRAKNLQGNTIRIKLRWHDFTTLTRQTSIATQTSSETIILTEALKLLNQAWQTRTPIRLLGVGVSNLRTTDQQLSLFASPASADSPRLRKLVDEIQDRFGPDALRPARQLKQPPP